MQKTDYYPFGMQMPGREYNAAGAYRYGFNGKEKDKDIDGNNYDYGFRIYNSGLGRFLSVDPLTNAFPWYTPYQFAGNKPTRYIDLDGLEDVDPIVVIQEPKSVGEPGLAVTTVRKTYFVVTKGAGALNSSQQSSINVKDINKQLNSTPNEPAIFSELPGASGSGTYLPVDKNFYKDLMSGDEKKKAKALQGINEPFYAVTTNFDVNIVVSPDMTLEEAAAKIALDPQKYGIIYNNVDDAIVTAMKLPTSIKDLTKDANAQFAQGLNTFTSQEAEAYGSIKNSINPNSLDVIIFNSNSTNNSMTMTDRICHEMGHNFTNQFHDLTHTYNYQDRGLQNDGQKSVVPTSENKVHILISNTQTDIYDKVVLNPDQVHA